MNSLQEAANEFRTKLATGISKSGQLKKILKEANIKSTEKDREELLKRATEHFSKNLEERIHNLLHSTEIDSKLEELKKNMKESEELNEELGVDSGYRPPNIDVVGHLEVVQSGYLGMLEDQLQKINDEVAQEKADLIEKMAIIENLQKEINSYLGK